MYEVGTIASIRQILKQPKQILCIMVLGERRAMLKKQEDYEGYLRAEIEGVVNPALLSRR